MSDFTEKVRKTLDAATPGPWEDDAYVGDDPYDDPDVPFVKTGQVEWSPSRLEIPASLQQKRDAELIAAAPTLLREACERIERLELLKEECEFALDIADAEISTSTPEAWEDLLRIGERQYEKLREMIFALDAKEQS